MKPRKIELQTPEHLLNVTVQPLIFGLLFNYVLSRASILPIHDNTRGHLVDLALFVPLGSWLCVRRARH